MRKIVIEVPERCGECRLFLSLGWGHWNCPFKKKSIRNASIYRTKPTKACREATVKED